MARPQPLDDQHLAAAYRRDARRLVAVDLVGEAYQPPCAVVSQVGRALPAPPTVRLLPKTRRTPKHHG